MGNKKAPPEIDVNATNPCGEVDGFDVNTTKYTAPDDQFSAAIKGVQNSYVEWIHSVTGNSSVPAKNWRLQLNSALICLEDLVMTQKK